jgi:hypothetical protein
VRVREHFEEEPAEQAREHAHRQKEAGPAGQPDAAGDRKAPRHEIAVERVVAVPRALWGFGRGG